MHLDAGALSKLGWLAIIGISAAPYGFLLSVVVSTFFAATALKRIVSRLVENPSASQLRTTLADALHDPSLELGFRLEQAGGFVDSSGKPLHPLPPVGQSWASVTRDGETVALIIHDAALDTDPELVSAAGQALALAVENGRLTAEPQSTNAELRVTRARIVATGDAERRKIERDLHDGAQQHSVALSYKVGLAREFADPEVAQRLDDVGEELEEILVSSATSPIASTRLYFANSDSGRPWPASCGGRLHRRSSRHRRSAATPKTWRPPSTSAAWKALHNVAKHAGSGATAVIRLWGRDGRLEFEIVDDGGGL